MLSLRRLGADTNTLLLNARKRSIRVRSFYCFDTLFNSPANRLTAATIRVDALNSTLDTF